jgi:tetraacyldisaccharide-1-P 4'-kinase
MADAAVVAILKAEFRRMKEELDCLRQNARRAEYANRETRSKLEQERLAPLARASERVQALNMAKDVAGFASEVSQQVEELRRASGIQVAQSQHLKDHVRLAQRRIDEIDAENQ